MMSNMQLFRNIKGTDMNTGLDVGIIVESRNISSQVVMGVLIVVIGEWLIETSSSLDDELNKLMELVTFQ